MFLKRICIVVACVLFATNISFGKGRVLIVSIDGLRPDVMLRADMPHVRELMQAGSFTLWATTTPAAITLPSHTSMVTGVTIERHGISGNDDKAAAQEHLLVPTIFDLAKAAGVTTGMSSGKSKFSIFAPPIDYPWYSGHGEKFSIDSGTNVAHDEVTANHAVEIIHDHQPELIFLHFGWNDVIGHSKGWGSADQITGLADTDKQLGRVLDALKDIHQLDQTTIILTADHGGAGRTHGPDDDYSKFIPWIISGPGVRKNYDLSLIRTLHVRTYDTFATACYVLGITPAEDIDGKPITQAFIAADLLTNAKPSTTQPAAP